MSSNTRRQAVAGIVSFIGVSLTSTRLALASGAVSVADVTAYGADTSGARSSVVAFQAAYNALLSTGGEIYVPPGIYLLDAPLSFSGVAVALRGEGPALSMLKVTHASTAVAFSPSAPQNTVSVRNIGFVAVPTGAPSMLALSISVLSNAVSNTPTCEIENVDFYIDSISTASFFGCIYLNNVWRSHVSNISTSGPSKIVGGSYFVSIDGLSVDLIIDHATATLYDTAFVLTNSQNGHSPQGIHLLEPIIANCNVGFSSGSKAYPDNFNVLGFYVRGGEFSCNVMALNLYQVNSGWITDTHFGISTQTSSGTVCSLTGSNDIQITNCQISGQRGAGSGPPYIGVMLANLAVQQSYGNVIDSCVFTGLSTAIVFGSGVQENSASNVRMINPANFPHYQTAGVVVDNSGNTTNQAIWVTGISGTGRFGYLH